MTPPSTPATSSPARSAHSRARPRSPADAADLILGGAGVDVVNAGGGADWAYTSGAADRVCGNSGADHLYAGDDADLVFGGSGDDQAYGEAGADQVYGNTGADSLYGGAGTDRLQGNAGSDWVDGGTEADVLLGGTSAAGSADGGDVLLGAGGADVLVGDNAPSDVLADQPYPADLGSTDTTLGGADHLVGGDDDDRAYGGLADDAVFGGLGHDHAEGNPGADRIWGEAGDDDVIGGSSQLATGLFSGTEQGRPDAGDLLHGGAGQDVITGDNAAVTRGGTAHPVMAGRGFLTTRGVDLADEGSGAPTGVAGDDTIQAGGGVDVVFAQRGTDSVSLGEGADYGEGGPGTDAVHGDAGDDDVVGGSFTRGHRGHRPAGHRGHPRRRRRRGRRARRQRVAHPAHHGDHDPPHGGPGHHPARGGAVRPRSHRRPPGPPGPTSSRATPATTSSSARATTTRSTPAPRPTTPRAARAPTSCAAATATTTSSAARSRAARRRRRGEVGQPDAGDDVEGGVGLRPPPRRQRPADPSHGRAARLADAPGERGPDRLVPARGVTHHDLVGPVPASAAPQRSAGDALSGGTGVDVIFGQDGDDRVSGGGDDDYAEGDGGADVLHGDVALTTAEIVTAPPGAAWATPVVDGATVTAGQDDLTGGWARQGYRDGNDTVHGDGGDDFVVGDNGDVARVARRRTTERVYTQRYGAARPGVAKVRVAGDTASSTRCCPTTGSAATATCEVTGAWGGDTVLGGDGDDVLYGQDGNDQIWAGAGDDDVYGELGADTLYGEDGEDAILGDRGGVQNRYEDGSRSTTTSLTMPPAITYTSRLAGSVSREADLLHDVNGTDFVGGATSTPMKLDGITFGGVDRIRGGAGHDSIHAGAGDDLVNGDSGGDSVFGDRGNDVMWGGAGRVCLHTDAACLADPGTSGEYVDHLAGGKDADVIDWRPRGAYGTAPRYTDRTCSTGTVPVTTKKDGTTDPCSWFEMTDRADDVLTVAVDAGQPAPPGRGLGLRRLGPRRHAGRQRRERTQPRRPAHRLVGRLQPVEPLQRGVRRVHRRARPQPLGRVLPPGLGHGQRSRPPGRQRRRRDGRDLGVRRAGAGVHRGRQGPRDGQRLPDDSGSLRRRERLRRVLIRSTCLCVAGGRRAACPGRCHAAERRTRPGVCPVTRAKARLKAASDP